MGFSAFTTLDQGDGRVTSIDAGLNVTHVMTYIFGGWFELADSPAGTVIPIIGNADIIGETPNTADCYYYLTLDSGTQTVTFHARIDATTVATVTSSVNIDFDVRAFILVWVDAVAETINIKINDNPVDSQSVTLAAFSTTNTVGFIGIPNNADNDFGVSGYFDEWFMCKDPADLAVALALINSAVYKLGGGIEFAELSAGQKITLGLTSWWGFNETDPVGFYSDEAGGAVTWLNINWSLPFNFIFENGDSLVNFPMALLLSESIGSSDERALLPAKTFAEVITAADAVVKGFELGLFESMFMDDDVFTSPLLSNLVETIHLSAWLTIKRVGPITFGD